MWKTQEGKPSLSLSRRKSLSILWSLPWRGRHLQTRMHLSAACFFSFTVFSCSFSSHAHLHEAEWLTRQCTHSRRHTLSNLIKVGCFLRSANALCKQLCICVWDDELDSSQSCWHSTETVLEWPSANPLALINRIFNDKYSNGSWTNRLKTSCV